MKSTWNDLLEKINPEVSKSVRKELAAKVKSEQQELDRLKLVVVDLRAKSETVDYLQGRVSFLEECNKKLQENLDNSVPVSQKVLKKQIEDLKKERRKLDKYKQELRDEERKIKDKFNDWKVAESVILKGEAEKRADMVMDFARVVFNNPNIHSIQPKPVNSLSDGFIGKDPENPSSKKGSGPKK